MAKITNIRVVKAYRFDLDCGHQAHRIYKQGVPKNLTVDCPHCLQAENLEDEEDPEEESSALNPKRSANKRHSSFLAQQVWAGWMAFLTIFVLTSALNIYLLIHQVTHVSTATRFGRCWDSNASTTRQ